MISIDEVLTKIKAGEDVQLCDIYGAVALQGIEGREKREAALRAWMQQTEPDPDLNNANINIAISENPAASRNALQLGSLALLNTTDIEPIVVSSDTTALNNRTYHVIGSVTFTDPAQINGRGYIVFVRSGTATVGGQTFGVGAMIIRINLSGTWVNYPYIPTNNTFSTALSNFLSNPTSDNFALLLTDENGLSGGFVRSVGATLTSPNINGGATITGNVTLDGVQAAKLIDPVRTTLTGNGSTSTYAISGATGLTNPSALIVAIDGVLQEPSVDYNVSGGNITFTDPLPNGSKAVVISPTNTIQVGQVTPSDGSVTSAKIAAGVTLTSPIVNGASMVGPVNLTGQDVSTADRVMTRALGDDRYRQRVISRLATNTDNATTTLADTGLTVALDVGVWEISIVCIMVSQSFSTAPGFFVTPANTGTMSPLAGYRLVMNSGANVTANRIDTAGGFPASTRTGVADAMFDYKFTVNVTVAGNLLMRFRQNTADANFVRVQTGSYMIATRL